MNSIVRKRKQIHGVRSRATIWKLCCMTNKVYAVGKGPMYSYTVDGRLVQRAWMRGIVTCCAHDDRAYDAKGQLLQVCNATPTNVISQYDYTYDVAGRRVACGKSDSAFAQNDSVAYGYNARSELTNAVASVDADYRYAYDFDDIGNRRNSAERGTNSLSPLY